ncbi:hypothetical protein [Hymenobacter cellulosivorans]|uniref:Uncharacterized protein n=1 Tax=Hymenobacter cellulosivorans TaxID=2932249 RepID=A0ABY4FA44_9BACT|nr:hypothetical protein [Hymenobacter cellulosivorans]UOQ53400.1 hypothetical protein MUN80_01265 [Hymenobacter cellulosivorans]
MLLGVYWYYGFPEGLYHYDFFTYQPGTGGMAGGPAELTTTVRAANPASLLTAVQAVAARYPQMELLAQAHGSLLRLTLGGWALPDYAFFVATQLETVLHQHEATRTAEPLPADVPLLRLDRPADDTPPYRYGGIFAAVSSGPKKHQAETASLRLDCHLLLGHQEDFLKELDALCPAFGLDVLHYLDQEVATQVNLMLFFGNGRQGVGGAPLRYTNVDALANAVELLMVDYDAHRGHRGSYPTHYPRRGPHVVRVVDAEFVL